MVLSCESCDQAPLPGSVIHISMYFFLFLCFISWTEKIPLVKTSLENTWLSHEIGRCYLELEKYHKAKEFGEKSLAAGEECGDEVWQLNANVLIAQAQGNHFKEGVLWVKC